MGDPMRGKIHIIPPPESKTGRGVVYCGDFSVPGIAMHGKDSAIPISRYCGECWDLARNDTRWKRGV